MSGALITSLVHGQNQFARAQLTRSSTLVRPFLFSAGLETRYKGWLARTMGFDSANQDGRLLCD